GQIPASVRMWPAQSCHVAHHRIQWARSPPSSRQGSTAGQVAVDARIPGTSVASRWRLQPKRRDTAPAVAAAPPPPGRRAGAAGPELVCRAVQLILDGALDGNTEHALGARLGVSARHLRRLFAEHLGVTPDHLARSCRAHFARRLLDETDFTITEIAFAAGFGSVRQLNRVCREVFRAAPHELRARRRGSDRLVADGGLVLRLPFQPPLNWDAMLGYFDARAIAGVERVTVNTYRRTVVIDGDPGVLELSPGGPDHLLLRAHLPHWEGLIHVVQRARRVFNLDADV